MTLTELQNNEMVVAWWKKNFHGKQFQMIWQMLNDTHPMRYVDGTAVTASTAEKKLGTIEGYELALERIKLCTQFGSQSGELPTPTFEPVQIEDDGN